MIISYHCWKTYKECPKKFNKQYIRKDTATVPENEYFTLYGRLVEKFFAIYCSIWQQISENTIKQRMSSLYKDILNVSVVNWEAPFCSLSKEEIFEKAYSDVCAIIASDNINYFINAQSEVNFDIVLKNGNSISGRIDFVKDNFIFDGKGTNKIGKNVDKNQMLFYALLFFLKYKKLPTLSFFYYQFNTFIPVPLDLALLNEFRAGLSLDIKALSKLTEYNATPSYKSCKYCKYANSCTDFIKYRADRKKPSPLDHIKDDGIVTFGF